MVTEVPATFNKNILKSVCPQVESRQTDSVVLLDVNVMRVETLDRRSPCWTVKRLRKTVRNRRYRESENC